MRHATLADVIDQVILPALGEHAEDYDVEAIARDTHTWMIDTDADGNELLNTEGFEQTVDEDEFWTIVAKYDTTADNA